MLSSAKCNTALKFFFSPKGIFATNKVIDFDGK